MVVGGGVVVEGVGDGGGVMEGVWWEGCDGGGGG